MLCHHRLRQCDKKEKMIIQTENAQEHEMKNRKRKFYHTIAEIMCAAVVFTLCACAVETPGENNWAKQLSNTLNEKNYTVEIKTTQKNVGDPVFRRIEAYDGPSRKSHIESTDAKGRTSDIYYAAADGQCKIIEQDNDLHIWVEKTAAFDDKFFEACLVTERIKHFETLIDQNKLTYDAKTHCYTGSENLGDYIVDGETHHIRSLEIKIREDRILNFKEVYQREKDGEMKVFTDVVTFENIGRTTVELPETTFTEAEAEDIAAFSEKTSAISDAVSRKMQALNALTDDVEKQQQIAEEKRQAREAEEKNRSHSEIDSHLFPELTAWMKQIGAGSHE